MSQCSMVGRKLFYINNICDVLRIESSKYFFILFIYCSHKYVYHFFVYGGKGFKEIHWRKSKSFSVNFKKYPYPWQILIYLHWISKFVSDGKWDRFLCKKKKKNEVKQIKMSMSHKYIFSHFIKQIVYRNL